jgi:surface antigen
LHDSAENTGDETGGSMTTFHIPAGEANFRTLLTVVVLAISLSACAQTGPKTAVGAATGAAAGGLIGAAAGGGAEGIVAGVLLGGLLGGAIGNSLDNRDREYIRRSNYQSLEYGRTGEASTWRNPDSGHYGSVTPTRIYQERGGNYCREFTQTVIVNGQQQEGYGRACRQPDGSWKIR